MKPVIITSLSGGLGNQMFMYAAARAMALRMNAKLYTECEEGFKNDRLYRRNFALNYFNVDLQKASPLLGFHYPGGNFIHRVSRRLKRHIPCFWIKYLRENQYTPERIFTLPPSGYYMEGYWQSERYFEDYKDQVRKDFRIIKPISDSVREEAKMIQELGDRGIALCVRRYQEVKKFVNLSVVGKEYYLRAIECMARQVQKPVFICFSQTPEWVKENLSDNYEIRYITPKDYKGGEIDDLFLLTQCKYFIISNSTFYWWGAWLSEAPGKQVIAPHQWYFPETPLKEWTILRS